MNWQALEAVATSTLVLTSAGAIAYAGRQLKHEREYRSVDNLEKQLTFFLSEAFVAARRRLAVMRVDQQELVPWDLSDPPIAAFEVLDFYDHLGLLVKKGHLDVYDVWHTFYEWAQPVYVDLQPLIEGERSEFKDHYNELRRLMRQMDDIQIKRMHALHENHWALWTPDRILDHYRYEIEAGETLGRKRRAGRRSHHRAKVLDSSGTEIRKTEETVAGRK